MIFFKCLAVGWMLAWFFVLFKLYVRGVASGERDAFTSLYATVFMWLLIGLIPVLIVKFGWDFIR